MLNLFKRVWYVPAGCRNHEEVPKAFEKYKIEYRQMVMIDMETHLEVGTVYEFSCIPVKYGAIKLLLEGGNSYTPLEVILQK
jgi:hypothetical protein